MFVVLDKDTIVEEIILHLPKRKRGFKPKSPISEIINCILYKLKTGVQWALLPMEQLFSEVVPSYKTVFGHYRKWCEAGAWQTYWVEILKKNKSKIDCSSCDFDGSQTPAKKSGEEVGYQARKKAKTTNSLFLSDRQGLMLAMSQPISGEHHDLYNIETHFQEITSVLKKAKISTEGLFVNFDAGFDSENLRKITASEGIIANICENKRNQKSASETEHYFDKKLYKERYTIERSNAWMDSFRSVLNRFDTTVSSWVGFNYLAFIVLGLRKFKQNEK
ncbi:IS5 family transposase [Capnocytophaga stomatis]|uniref:IS5 family transposase n=1 Tax=Capnocytophaga stomatis TaxID=1848904 RepID=UPI00385A1877